MLKDKLWLLWSWKRALLHLPVGILTIVVPFSEIDSEIAAAIIAFALCLAFGLYEVTEDWHLKDKAFIDIQGWIVGLFIGLWAL